MASKTEENKASNCAEAQSQEARKDETKLNNSETNNSAMLNVCETLNKCSNNSTKTDVNVANFNRKDHDQEREKVAETAPQATIADPNLTSANPVPSELQASGTVASSENDQQRQQQLLNNNDDNEPNYDHFEISSQKQSNNDDDDFVPHAENRLDGDISDYFDGGSSKDQQVANANQNDASQETNANQNKDIKRLLVADKLLSSSGDAIRNSKLFSSGRRRRKRRKLRKQKLSSQQQLAKGRPKTKDALRNLSERLKPGRQALSSSFPVSGAALATQTRFAEPFGGSRASIIKMSGGGGGASTNANAEQLVTATTKPLATSIRHSLAMLNAAGQKLLLGKLSTPTVGGSGGVGDVYGPVASAPMTSMPSEDPYELLSSSEQFEAHSSGADSLQTYGSGGIEPPATTSDEAAHDFWTATAAATDVDELGAQLPHQHPFHHHRHPPPLRSHPLRSRQPRKGQLIPIEIIGIDPAVSSAILAVPDSGGVRDQLHDERDARASAPVDSSDSAKAAIGKQVADDPNHKPPTASIHHIHHFFPFDSLGRPGDAPAQADSDQQEQQTKDPQDPNKPQVQGSVVGADKVGEFEAVADQQRLPATGANSASPADNQATFVAEGDEQQLQDDQRQLVLGPNGQVLGVLGDASRLPPSSVSLLSSSPPRQRNLVMVSYKRGETLSTDAQDAGHATDGQAPPLPSSAQLPSRQPTTKGAFNEGQESAASFVGHVLNSHQTTRAQQQLANKLRANAAQLDAKSQQLERETIADINGYQQQQQQPRLPVLNSATRAQIARLLAEQRKLAAPSLLRQHSYFDAAQVPPSLVKQILAANAPNASWDLHANGVGGASVGVQPEAVERAPPARRVKPHKPQPRPPPLQPIQLPPQPPPVQPSIATTNDEQTESGNVKNLMLAFIALISLVTFIIFAVSVIRRYKWRSAACRFGGASTRRPRFAGLTLGRRRTSRSSSVQMAPAASVAPATAGRSVTNVSSPLTLAACISSSKTGGQGPLAAAFAAQDQNQQQTAAAKSVARRQTGNQLSTSSSAAFDTTRQSSAAQTTSIQTLNTRLATKPSLLFKSLLQTDDLDNSNKMPGHCTASTFGRAISRPRHDPAGCATCRAPPDNISKSALSKQCSCARL